MSRPIDRLRILRGHLQHRRPEHPNAYAVNDKIRADNVRRAERARELGGVRKFVVTWAILFPRQP